MPEVEGRTATEAVLKAISAIKQNGREVVRWGGTMQKFLKIPKGETNPQNYDRPMLEVPFLSVELTNPDANFTEIGTSTFITLREQLDHMYGVGGHNPGRVVNYSKRYATWLQPNGKLPPTYGERFRKYPTATGNIDQLDAMEKKLRNHPSSRKAYASLWMPEWDSDMDFVACNVGFQATIVDNELEWTTTNRSNDAYYGITENLFMFSTWARELAFRLGVRLGKVRQISTNAHIYLDANCDTTVPDPYDSFTPSPPIHSFHGVEDLILEADEYIDAEDSDRIHETVGEIHDIDPYWANWMATMATDWFTIRKDYVSALEFLNEVTNEFFPNVSKRLLHQVRKQQPDLLPEVEFLMRARGVTVAST